MISTRNSDVEDISNTHKQRVRKLISVILEKRQLLDESQEVLEKLKKSDRDLENMSTEELQDAIMEALR